MWGNPGGARKERDELFAPPARPVLLKHLIRRLISSSKATFGLRFSAWIKFVISIYLDYLCLSGQEQ